MEHILTFLLDIAFAVSNQLQAGLQHCKVKAFCNRRNINL